MGTLMTYIFLNKFKNEVAAVTQKKYFCNIFFQRVDKKTECWVKYIFFVNSKVGALPSHSYADHSASFVNGLIDNSGSLTNINKNFLKKLTKLVNSKSWIIPFPLNFELNKFVSIIILDHINAKKTAGSSKQSSRTKKM